MATLKIGNKTWVKRHINMLFTEGKALVNNQNAKVVNLVRYGHKVKRHIATDKSIMDDASWQEIIASDKSWQKPS